MPRVRGAGREDLPSIAAIQAACPKAADWNPEEYLAYDLLVAETGSGEIAGFLCSRQTAADEREILNIAVVPAQRRRGVARALFQSSLESFRGDVFLEVRISNSDAIRFYEVLGFERLTVRKDYYSHPLEDGVVMRLHSC